jgi:xanthine dehydrogenase accessory factor
MNELQSIVAAYAEACASGQRAALATVVGVEGSAYRRPGARMLMTEDGRTTGTISGGCLERDVSERAARVLASGEAQLVVYDTRRSEDIIWGLGLGCNGVVRILLESLHAGSSGQRALSFIADCLQARSSGALATVIAAKATAEGGDGNTIAVGARLLLDAELNVRGQSLTDEALIARIRADAPEILADKRSAQRSYEAGALSVEIFYDVIKPPRPLVIFGAEHDALPLTHLARTLGWHVTIVDTRSRAATRERFAEADAVTLCRAEGIAARLSLSEDTAAVIMTHNYLTDLELLRALLPSRVCYLGIMGPKQRTFKLLEELAAEARGSADWQLARLHSPIGIDLGAETPEEIALSIISEIKAVCAARGGGFLRDRDAPIHDETEPAASVVSLGTFASTTERESLAACHSS